MSISRGDAIYLSQGNWHRWQHFATRLLEFGGLLAWKDKATYLEEENISSPFDIDRLKQHKQRAALLKSHLTAEVELVVWHLNDPADIWET